MNNPNPPTGYFSTSTSDPDQAEQIYLRSIADAKILHLGNREDFRLKMDYLEFNKVSLISNSMTSACSMEASLEKDEFRLVLALNAPTQFSWRGRPYSVFERQGIIVNPGSKIKVERCAGSKTLIINTSYSTLKDHLKLLTNRDIKESLKFDKKIDFSQGPGTYLYVLMNRLSHDVLYNGMLLTQPGIQRGYGELILGAILALPHNHIHLLQPEDSSLVAPKIIHRAEEYIRAHFKERITIGDVIQVCQCSRKELFSSFRSSRDYTPMEFLLEQRLQAAHRELLKSLSAPRAISEIAYACGFTHLGRFSKQYRNRFGELPSETAKRTDRSIH